MARFNFIQNNFISGEISERFRARTDTDLYQQGLKELKNGIVHTQGGATRRGGTQFFKDELLQRRLTDASFLFGGLREGYSGYVRVIEFIASRSEAYVIVIKQDGADTSISIVNVNTGTEAVFSIAPELVALRTSSVSQFDGYDSDDQLREVQVAQTGDVMFFVHPDKEPFVIERVGTNVFRRNTLTPGSTTGKDEPFRGLPYLPVNTDGGHTMAISGASGTTLTSSKAFFTSDHVGAVFKHTTGGTTTTFRVTAFTSSTVVTGESGNSTAASGPRAASADWEESAWSPERGYPRTVTTFQQRVYYGGTEFQPDTVYASQIADLFELDQRGLATDASFGTIVASDPFSFAPSSAVINQIQWMASTSRSLNVGTLGREYTIQGSQGAISALDIFISPETQFGSFFRQPVVVDNALIFVQGSRKKLRQFLFSRDENSFKAEDLTWISQGIFKRSAVDRNPSDGALNSKIEQIKFQEGTNSVIWVIDADNGLFALTEDRAHGVRAASYCPIGGNLDGNTPKVHSIAVAPNADQGIDELWMMVERTIDGSDVTYLEKIGKEYEADEIGNTSTDINDKLVFSDSAIFVNTIIPATTVTGLDHLEGETVQIIGDGFFLGEATVSGGEVDVDTPVGKRLWVIGLKYETKINTLPMEAGSVIGSAQGSIKRIDRSVIRFLRTIGAKFGSDPSDLETIIFRPPDLAMDTPIPLFTGDKTLEFPAHYDRLGEVIIVQDLPLPMTVLGIISRGITYD